MQNAGPRMIHGPGRSSGKVERAAKLQYRYPKAPSDNILGFRLVSALLFHGPCLEKASDTCSLTPPIHGSRFSPRSRPSSTGPSSLSRAASYSSRLYASRARSAMRPVRPLPPFAASMRQPRNLYECSRRGSCSPLSRERSRSACSASASSRGSRNSTAGSLCKLAYFLQVDPVLRDHHLQVFRRAPQIVAPLAVEDLRVSGVGFQDYAIFRLLEHRGMLRELAAPDGVPAVDRVSRPETLYAGGRGVQLLRDPRVTPTLLDPLPDLGRVRL